MKKWNSTSEYLTAVQDAHTPGGRVDPRLMNAPTTVSTTGVGESGGFNAPYDFSTEITSVVFSDNAVVSLTDQQPTDSGAAVFPIDGVAPSDNSTGFIVQRMGEGTQIPQSKPALGQVDIKLPKIACFAPISEEAGESVTTLSMNFSKMLAPKFGYQLEREIISGTGSGESVGILSSACTIEVSKDTSTSPVQPAATVRSSNILSMWSRLYGPSRAKAVWLMNPDSEDQLPKMLSDETAATPVPLRLYAPESRTLMGRPIVTSEACPGLGSRGDIILCDLSQYLLLSKRGGLKQTLSLHVFFEHGTGAFRFTLRAMGVPWWPAAVSVPNSALTRSPFVTLAARA